MHELKHNLQELLLLTLETLNAHATPNGQAQMTDDTKNSVDDDDPFAKEMALLMAELNDSETMTNEQQQQQQQQESDELDRLREKLVNLVGNKCSAPHTHAWGATSHHNALVCAADSIDDIADEATIKVRVLFTNPTHKNMVPCPFYLDGNCRFDADKCRYFLTYYTYMNNVCFN